MDRRPNASKTTNPEEEVDSWTKGQWASAASTVRRSLGAIETTPPPPAWSAAPWLHEFKVEVMAFPNGKHDDQIDSLSQFLSWIGNRQRGRRELIRPQTVDRPLGPMRRPAILVRSKPGRE